MKKRYRSMPVAATPGTPRGPSWFDRFERFWNKYQKWGWGALFLSVFIWTAYDVGQMVARADLLAGSRAVRGAITVKDLRKKVDESKGAGGRLIIMSEDQARFIDASGQAWNIPRFGDTVTRDDLKSFKKHHVSVDGGFNISVHPVKTRPGDLIMATLADLMLKFGFIALYGVIILFVLRMGKSKKRFSRISPKEDMPSIEDVVGYEGVKEELLEVIDYLRDPRRFHKAGARPPRGVLLYGPPGNGKTMLTKALAQEANAAFFEQSASSFIELYVGAGAREVRRLFAVARKAAPSVIFIDELDAIGASRGAAAHDERIQTLNAILAEMDGFSSTTGVVVVAATNRLDVLDKALIRPGRFDRKVWIGPPTMSDRRAILERAAFKLPQPSEVDWSRWAQRTAGMSCADIAALVNEAAIEAARADRSVITEADLRAARDRVRLGAVRRGHALSDRERRTIAAHELGHAWMTRRVGRRVERVSVQARGQALGVTFTEVDVSERVLLNREDVTRDLLTLMGGRAAEQAIMGGITSGAVDDMQKASELARAAAQQLGSTRWGSYLPENERSRETLDRAAALLVNEAFEVATQDIAKHKEEVSRAVSDLLMKENIDAATLDNLWPTPPFDPLPDFESWNPPSALPPPRNAQGESSQESESRG